MVYAGQAWKETAMHKLPSLISALILPLIGPSLLFCLSAKPRLGPAVLASTDISEARQLKPALYNRTRLILLNKQYGHYERCCRHLRLARSACEEARWHTKMREAVRLYNQVADDTDPSAFARTPLPRHLLRE